MRILTKNTVVENVTIGRLSNGSDRQVIQQTNVLVKFMDRDGHVQELVFDHDPTDAEVLGAISRSVDVTPVTKADWADQMVLTYAVWWRWKNTLAEAQARGLAAGIITALTNQTNAAWSAYAQAIQSWNSAP